MQSELQNAKTICKTTFIYSGISFLYNINQV